MPRWPPSIFGPPRFTATGTTPSSHDSPQTDAVVRAQALSVRYRDCLFRDEEGEDVPSAIEMKVRALETARDLIRIPFLAIPDWLDCTLEVTDETGTMVLSLPFPEALDA